MKKKYIKSYTRVMNHVDMSDEAKQRIAKNCARYSTLQKIKRGRFVITAIKTEKTTDGR